MTTTIAQRRSAELEELIDRDAGTFRILTGDRPTGRLTWAITSAPCGTGSGCRNSARRCSC